MRAHEFIPEARKNPEKNIKVSVNKYIIDRLDKTKDMIGDIPNLFVSFTAIDKLGLNPTSKYNTPLGIYSYPASYINNKVGSNDPMSELPFAGKEPYVNIFNAYGNIVDLVKMTDNQEDHYYKKIMQFYMHDHNLKKGSPEWEEAIASVEKIIKDASTRARHHTIPGGRFWYVCWEVSKMLSGKPSVAWNKLFRNIGIDGCLDTGYGIIHPSEPTQAVFFSIISIKNNQRVHNKYSPRHLWSRQTISDMMFEYSQIKDIQEKIQFLSRLGNKLSYFKNLSPAMQMELVKYKPSVFIYLRYSKNLIPEVAEYALTNMKVQDLLGIEDFAILGDDKIMHILLNRSDQDDLWEYIPETTWFSQLKENSISLSAVDEDKLMSKDIDKLKTSLMIKNPTPDLKHQIKRYLLSFKGMPIPAYPAYLKNMLQSYFSAHEDIKAWFYEKDDYKNV